MKVFVKVKMLYYPKILHKCVVGNVPKREKREKEQPTKKKRPVINLYIFRTFDYKTLLYVSNLKKYLTKSM